MYSARENGAAPRICIRLVLLVLFLSSSGASVLPGLLSSGSTSVDPAVSANRFDLLMQANGEVLLYPRGYSPTGFDAGRSRLRWRVP